LYTNEGGVLFPRSEADGAITTKLSVFARSLLDSSEENLSLLEFELVFDASSCYN
jgi:hypothetical protein